MIERNLGNMERVVRLVLGIAMLGWAFLQSGMNAMDWFVILVAIALVLNGIFSRCYLWYVLDINSFSGRDKDCQPEATCI